MEELENIDLVYFATKDTENKLCADCGNSLPDFVSINHGILICQKCASTHLKLGYNISYVRSVSDRWDPYLIAYMNRGGNNRFLRFCFKYKLNGIPIEQKYIKRSMEYYRLLLRSEVLAEEPPEIIGNQFANDNCDLDIIYFPEFKEYSIYKGEVPNVENGISTVDIGKKLYEGGCTTFNAIKTTGGFIYSTTKPVVSFLGNVAWKGLNKAYNYMTDKGNDQNNPNNSNNKNNQGFVIQNNINNSVLNDDFGDFSQNNNSNNIYSFNNQNQIKDMDNSNYIINNNNNNINGNINNNDFNTYDNFINNSNDNKQKISNNSNMDNSIPNYPIFDAQENIVQGNYNYGNFIKPDIATNECIQMGENNNFQGEIGFNIAKEETFEQEIEYGNSNKEKAREDANAYLLKH